MTAHTPHSEPHGSHSPRRRLAGFLILIAVYLFVVFVVPRPAAVKPEGWRLTGIFLATIAGSILQPVPGGALVLIAITLASIFGGLTHSTGAGRVCRSHGLAGDGGFLHLAGTD